MSDGYKNTEKYNEIKCITALITNCCDNSGSKLASNIRNISELELN